MLTAMGDVMRQAYEKGWITTRDGNVSLKRSGKRTIYITPSGWRKTIIHPEHILRVRVSDEGYSISGSGDSKPSGELHMHAKLHEMHRSTKAVVHLHPTNIIAAMYAGWDLQALAAEFPEVSRYTKVGPTVPVLPVTSLVLAEATLNAFTDNGTLNHLKYDIVGQANHGVCAVGPNPWDAYEHIERLEHIGEIVLKSGVNTKKESFKCKYRGNSL